MKQSRIAEQRKKLGLSQVELASKLKISQKSISKYERGDRRPSYEILSAMSSLFGVSVDYLIGNEDIKDAPTLSKDTKCPEFDYITTDEKNLIEIFREYNTTGFNERILEYIVRLFPEAYELFINLNDEQKKLLKAFDELNEDNKDIIIGETKKLLKSQRLEESSTSTEQIKEAK